MFDLVELERISKGAAVEKYFERLRGAELNGVNAEDKKAIYQSAKDAALFAVAAHVREQTLREAAELVRNADVVGGGRYLREDNARDTLWEAAAELEKLAASARETGGAITLDQSAARLHEKYGDALAKLDDDKKVTRTITTTYTRKDRP